MASEQNLGFLGADGLPIVGLRTFITNPATGLPFSGNANNELIQQLKDSIPVSNTGAAAAAVTLTLPAGAAGKFTYLTYLQIIMYAAAALTGSATPVVVTTTNLPGSLAFTFPTAAAIGTIVEEKSEGVALMKGSAAATAITIVCPATTGVIWRVNGAYFIA
jgi:hypothetical protein